MRPGPRLPAAALVLLLHAGALVLFWSGARPLTVPGAEQQTVELRLIAPRPEPRRAVAATAPPTALPMPALPSVAIELPLIVSLLPAALPTTSPIEAGGAAVVVTSPPAMPAPVDYASAEPPRPARRADCAPAAHPPLLRERGIEGLVRLRVWVDELGRAGEVLLTASSGFRLFDEAAIAQARRCPYEAAREGGRPMASWVEFPIRFALNQTGELRDAQP
jgi:protein TonB